MDALDPTLPVFTGFRGERDFFAADPNLRTPYTQNFNLNVQQQLGGQGGAPDRLRWIEGNQAVPFLDINQPSQQQITASDLAAVRRIHVSQLSDRWHRGPRRKFQ